MRRNNNTNPSQYYRFACCDGLEALSAQNHNTPFPAHYHPTYNITLIYSGTFHTKLTGRQVLSPQGSILITNPDEIHANPIVKGSQVSFFTFYVSHSFIKYCNSGNTVLFEQKSIEDDALFTRLHQLSVQLVTHNDFRLLEQELKLTFAALAQKHGSGHEREPGQEQLLFNELLADDRFEKFSLTEAAKHFGIDKYKFIRLFKEQTGLTPNNYFIYKRIEKSKTLLAEGHDLLSVAIDLGFYDAAHFANHFKKFTGISPMGYTSGR